jgi:phage/plasmid-associated DNA primase
MWDGQRLQETGDQVVLFVIMHQLSTVYERRANELKEEFEKSSDEEEKKVVQELLGSLKNYNASHAVSATLAVMKGQMQKCLAEEFDADPEILNLHNGVLNLRTGQLDVHRPGYLCTKMAGANFRVSFPSSMNVRACEASKILLCLANVVQLLWALIFSKRPCQSCLVFKSF